MENASKALIIAGAILLSILIISLGIFIFQQAKGPVNTDSIDQMQVDAFNCKFDKYVGTKIRGAQVKALINAVNTNNNTTDDEGKKVEIQYQGGLTAAKISTGKTYTVDIPEGKDGHTSAGLIRIIKITENSNT